MATTTNWDQVTALNRNFHIPKLTDNVFFGNAFLTRCKSRIKKRELGKIIVAPLLVGLEGNGGDWYAGTDQHDTTIRNPITSATFFGKNAIVASAIDETEELEATTAEKVADLIEDKMQIMEETQRFLLCNALFNAGTNPKALTGLQLAIPATSAATYIAAQTYGGITCGGSAVSADTNGYWQPNVDTNGGANYTTGPAGTFMQSTTGNPLASMFAKAFLRCGRKPNLIVSNIGSWTDYHNSLVKNERYDRALKNIKMAESGFDSLMYQGATWITDPLAPRTSAATPVETVYVLDTNTFDLYWDPRRKFYMTPWREPYNQSTRVSYLKNRLELIFRERRSSGAITVNSAL